MANIIFTLTYDGESSERAQIDFYDVAIALVGFQRSLSLTTHLILNDEVITQSTALKGAKIYALPPEEGSWKINAAVILGGLYTIGTTPAGTPLGNLVRSAYDYVISESLGFHVDYEKSLGQQYEEFNSQKGQIEYLDQSRFDSVIEKCEAAVRDIHRPIVKSKTANSAKIIFKSEEKQILIGKEFNNGTYEYVSETRTSDISFVLVGKISSYNINTFKGRIYLPVERRPVPFELVENARKRKNYDLLLGSMAINAQNRNDDGALLALEAFKNTSRSGQLKGLYVVDVQRLSELDIFR